MPELSLVHVVRPAVPSDRPPALVLLHGVGSNERSMAPLARAFDPRLLVVSARSPLAIGPDAFAWFHVTFTPTGPSIDEAEAAAGWAHVARFVDELVEAYGVDPQRVFVAGFSQGAIMALAALVTAPERIAGVIAMSGRLLPEVLPHAAPAEALRGKPVLLIHGTADDKLGVHFARSAREKLQQLGIDLAYSELAMGHGITESSLALATRWMTEQLDRGSA